MIDLDHQLIFEARRLMTGADVHRIKEMIFAYEQAVELHNRAFHHRYQPEHEATLRSYVVRRRLEELDRCIAHVRQYTRHLSETSSRLHTRSEELNQLIETW